jgi:microcystin-dependent protein
LQSRLPVHQGQGLGLSTYVIGQLGGTEQVTLTTGNMPQHNHALNATTTQANATKVANNVIPGAVGSNLHFYLTQGSGPAPILYQMNPGACTPAGNSIPHTNMMPSLCITFVIALQGVYPSQN